MIDLHELLEEIKEDLYLIKLHLNDTIKDIDKKIGKIKDALEK